MLDFELAEILIGQREYLLLSMQVSENLFDTMNLRSDLRAVEERMANVIDKLGDFVTHSELFEMMPGFEEDEVAMCDLEQKRNFQSHKL